MTSTSARALSDSLDKLQITQDTTRTSGTKQKTSTVDSWEDEVDNTLIEKQTPVQPLSSPVSEFPEAPPTSPISPSVRTKATSSHSPFQTFPPFGMNGSFETDVDIRPTSTTSDHDRRPEKTTSVASRLIAAGIGQKPPKRTQEQREYDQAMKLQEKKRRDAAKEEALRSQREKEKAQLAIWED
ncbi:hypothetical protein AMS68_007601 [Peltaster fructicola]|uniref:Uncharacterized protein n=1 Tax=Peltaster fructicola TaxID=286661 RepID=A0A6H0Y4Z2_9PEZI|nr:hypothetical protein AMS68_007601 [Peltaster fructicola]